MVRVPAETVYQLSEVGSCLSNSETFLISSCPYKVRQYLCSTIDFETRRNKISSTVLQAMDLWNFAIHNNIHLKATHILRVRNELADRFSRKKVIVTEWSLHKSVVLQMFQTWGFPLIDLFASTENRQSYFWLMDFTSRSFSSGCPVNYMGKMFKNAYTPICLIPKILQKYNPNSVSDSEFVTAASHTSVNTASMYSFWMLFPGIFLTGPTYCFNTKH